MLRWLALLMIRRTLLFPSACLSHRSHDVLTLHHAFSLIMRCVSFSTSRPFMITACHPNSSFDTRPVCLLIALTLAARHIFSLIRHDSTHLVTALWSLLRLHDSSASRSTVLKPSMPWSDLTAAAALLCSTASMHVSSASMIDTSWTKRFAFVERPKHSLLSPIHAKSAARSLRLRTDVTNRSEHLCCCRVATNLDPHPLRVRPAIRRPHIHEAFAFALAFIQHSPIPPRQHATHLLSALRSARCCISCPRRLRPPEAELWSHHSVKHSEMMAACVRSRSFVSSFRIRRLYSTRSVHVRSTFDLGFCKTPEACFFSVSIKLAGFWPIEFSCFGF